MDLDKMTIGEVAALIPGSTNIFRKHGVEFCCGGYKSINEVFQKLPNLKAELLSLNADDNESYYHKSFPEIIDHILEYHFKHRSDLAEILLLAKKVEKVHGEHPKAPIGLSDLIGEMVTELESHMQKEEQILFPLLLKDPNVKPMMPIRRMMEEHDGHRKNLEKIKELTHNFYEDEESCTSWKALNQNLKQFIQDITEHIHLENNILFKRAMG